jgi:hypothetical protein
MMDKLRALLLHGGAWQLFVLLFAVPYVLIFMSIIAFISGFSRSIFLFALLTFLYSICFIGWYWVLGNFLSSLLKPNLRLSTALLKFSAAYPIFYIPTFLCGVIFTSTIQAPALIVPLHLLAMCCMLYLIYYVAKSLALVQLGRPVTFSDYAPQFFGLWFYPIGVWFIQPKVNQLYRAHCCGMSVQPE